MSQATADELAAISSTKRIQNTNDASQVSQASQASQISQPGANDTTSTTSTSTSTSTTTTKVDDADKNINGSNDKPDDNDEKSNDLAPIAKTDITLTLKATPEYNSFPFSVLFCFKICFLLFWVCVV